MFVSVITTPPVSQLVTGHRLSQTNHFLVLKGNVRANTPQHRDLFMQVLRALVSHNTPRVLSIQPLDVNAPSLEPLPVPYWHRKAAA